MIKIIKVLFVSTLFVLSTKVYAHCQVPCGIYGDAVRIVQIEEDITTVRKAMNMINDLAGKSDAQSLNQISRWITTKEDHAQKVQETVLNYFLAQRVKASAIFSSVISSSWVVGRIVGAAPSASITSVLSAPISNHSAILQAVLTPSTSTMIP